MPGDDVSSGWHLPASQLQQVRAGLAELGTPGALVEAVLPLLPRSTSGVLVYGSWARGDARAASDLDILVMIEGISRRGRPASDDRISLSFYRERQVRDATGTLFGYHLARDGKVLFDLHGRLVSALAAIEPPEPEALLAKIQRLSEVLTVATEERQRHLTGLTQVARYLLRSAMYADALRNGDPCFSVGELAVRHNDETLRELLSSHALEQRPVSESTFIELAERLTQIVGPPPGSMAGTTQEGLAVAGKTLEALVVEEWSVDRELSNLALLALGTDDEEVPYSELPKVVL